MARHLPKVRLTFPTKLMSKILGSDLGTTNSCMAVLEGGKATVSPSGSSSRPSREVWGWRPSCRCQLATRLWAMR